MKAGWEVRPLGEVCEKIQDGAHQSPKESFAVRTPGTFPYVTSKNIRNWNLDETDIRFVGQDFHDSIYPRCNAEFGDVLLTKDGSNTGQVTINTFREPISLLSSVCLIKPQRTKLDARFLVYYLQSGDGFENITGQMTGAAIKRIILKNIKTSRIPLPPLEEQQRIVAVLDEAFDGLSRARAHAEANLQNAREFFTTVLRDIFRNDSKKWQGEFPQDQIEATTKTNLTRSRDLTQTGGREATLRPLAGPYSLTVLRPSIAARKGWRWSKLTDLARLESGHTPSRKHPEYWGGDLPWIGIKDARDHHGTEIYETLENTNPLGIANSSARMLPARTVCLSRTASVGYVTIMGRDMATSQDFVNWICGDALLPEFLKLVLLAQGDDIRRFASGSVHQTIYFPEVKAFHICYPPVAVQRQICEAMGVVHEQSISLIALYEMKVSALDALRQSLLQKAFAGELT